jgi:hypothetical protein
VSSASGSPVVVGTNALEVARSLDLKAKKLAQVVKNIAHDMGNRVWLDYLRTVETWQHIPKFERIVEVTGDTVTVLVGTDDPIYKYIDLGTRVRYATMTPGFVAKTRPGILGSRAGKGGVLFISKKHPKPGIEARRFTETIQKKQDELMVEVAEKYVREWQAK